MTNKIKLVDVVAVMEDTEKVEYTVHVKVPVPIDEDVDDFVHEYIFDNVDFYALDDNIESNIIKFDGGTGFVTKTVMCSEISISHD